MGDFTIVEKGQREFSRTFGNPGVEKTRKQTILLFSPISHFLSFLSIFCSYRHARIELRSPTHSNNTPHSYYCVFVMIMLVCGTCVKSKGEPVFTAIAHSGVETPPFKTVFFLPSSHDLCRQR